ncbi:MAG: hypothetical protein ACLUB2_03405 [Butyricicoccus pullicaecorum]
MSIIVSGIRLPFDENDGAAVTQALSLCGLTANDAQASIYRVSLDARRGKIDRVYSVLLDGIDQEEAFAAQLQMPSVRYALCAYRRKSALLLWNIGRLLSVWPRRLVRCIPRTIWLSSDRP